MAEPVTWYTDRTRYMTGLQHCPMARYLKFHSHEGGIAKTGRTVPLATGVYTHEALANILQLGQPKLKELMDGGDLNEFLLPITLAVDNYRAEVIKRGFLTPEDDHVVKEQAFLIEALSWAWIVSVLPYLLTNFDIALVEEETPFILANRPGLDIVQLQRTDLVLKAKATGRYGSLDFKTERSFGPSYPETYRESLQLSLQCLGPALYLGVDVPEYYVLGLLKGRRDFFTRDGASSPSKRQYSDLCYATLRSSHPSLVFDTKGWWYDKTPVWEIEFPACTGCDHAISKAYHWVFCCLGRTAGILDSMFQFVGPYPRNDVLINQYLAAAPEEEILWRERHELGNGQEKTFGFGSDLCQKWLDTFIPRSYKCQEYYGSRCEFYELCFKHEGWRDPATLGYEKRTPHHEGEGE